MSFLKSLDISASGLTAQKFRMDIISQNIANAQTTRTEEGGPYRRKAVVLASRETRETFKDALDGAVKAGPAGVRVKTIAEDPSPFVPVYDPSHPDADSDVYVMLPNVNTAQEIIDMLAASRAYESNVTALNSIKAMALKALEIGK